MCLKIQEWNMDNGWVKLFRSMCDCRTASRGLTYFGAMAWMVAKASYEDTWFDGCRVVRGQLFCGLPYLSKEWKIGIQSVRTILKHLENDGFLTSKPTNRGRIITICNYESYQFRETNGQQTGQQANNRQLTGEQQASNTFQEVQEIINNIARTRKGIFPVLQKALTDDGLTEFARYLSVWQEMHGNGRPMPNAMLEGQMRTLLAMPEEIRTEAICKAANGAWKQIRDIRTSGISANTAKNNGGEDNPSKYQTRSYN